MYACVLVCLCGYVCGVVQGNHLAVYLMVSLQSANVVPALAMVYGPRLAKSVVPQTTRVAYHWCPNGLLYLLLLDGWLTGLRGDACAYLRSVRVEFVVWSLLALGFVVTQLLAALWHRTVDCFGQPRSLPLYILTFLV
jgi:hypothetical protein